MSEDRAPITGWYLEGYLPNDAELMRCTINNLPFRVGGGGGLSLPIPAHGVSWNHAEIFHSGTHLCIRDLNSTNGTYVNRNRIAEVVNLQADDVIHFANVEFRLRQHAPVDPQQNTLNTGQEGFGLASRFYDNPRAFREMLASKAVHVLYQPIVSLEKGNRRVGFEALGRTAHKGLPESPAALFGIAASMGTEAELSRLLRLRAVEDATQLPNNPYIFLNTRPMETHRPELIEELTQLRRRYRDMRLVIEIHEAAITDPVQMRELSNALHKLRIQIAFDDFGAGQARLLELVDAPPHFLKFDRSLIQGIAAAVPNKRQLVERLVRMSIDMGIVPLAEGVENIDDARVCAELGFELGQGWLFGRPAPVNTFPEDTEEVRHLRA
jgi:EAL domain-containing protein (putative c-di-GMP-specific phosphodiesterase class I)